MQIPLCYYDAGDNGIAGFIMLFQFKNTGVQTNGLTIRNSIIRKHEIKNKRSINMKKGVRKSIISAVAICTLIVATMGIGIASAKTESPNGNDSWTYYSSFNVIKWQKSCHSNYKSIDEHTSTAQVGNFPKVKVAAAANKTSYAVAYGDEGTGKAWYNNTTDMGSILGL